MPWESASVSDRMLAENAACVSVCLYICILYPVCVVRAPAPGSRSPANPFFPHLRSQSHVLSALNLLMGPLFSSFTSSSFSSAGSRAALRRL